MSDFNFLLRLEEGEMDRIKDDIRSNYIPFEEGEKIVRWNHYGGYGPINIGQVYTFDEGGERFDNLCYIKEYNSGGLFSYRYLRVEDFIARFNVVPKGYKRKVLSYFDDSLFTIN